MKDIKYGQGHPQFDIENFWFGMRVGFARGMVKVEHISMLFHLIGDFEGASMAMLQGSGVKSWESQRSANSSIAAMCAHDLAFLRTGTGHFVLRAFKRDTMHVGLLQPHLARLLAVPYVTHAVLSIVLDT